MITDPLTLGITNYVDVFDIIETGPGAKSSRTAQAATNTGTFIDQGRMSLTISHEIIKKSDRKRSLFRLSYPDPALNITLGSATGVPSPSVSLVIDRTNLSYSGETAAQVKHLLARLLGFLSNNATAAPDFTFTAQTKVLEFLNGEP